MKKSFITILGSLALAALGSSAARAQTYQLVWADEFNGSISPAWKFETGGGGWGNNEKQYYQAANATVTATDLLITAKKESVGGMPYTSARMKTDGLKSFTYGKMEARIKLPLGQGLWPAFWMLGSNIGTVGWPKCGEIDIMEQINADSRTYGTAHWDNNGQADYGQSTPTAANVYHVYSVEWTPTAITWKVDGTQYNSINIANGAGGTDEFQRPFFLLLNMAVAGNWPGQTVDESKLPATMYVDYVRVYQQTSAPAPSSITLQAESANTNHGMVVETCSEGGQDMGYIDAGDYLVFNNINFPTSGTYTIEYRVASGAGGGTISCDLNAGSTQLGSTAVPATGGWQNWTTVSKSVTVNAGTYNFGVFAQTGGYNLNWVRITKTSARGALATTAAKTGFSGADKLDLYPNPVTDRLQLHAQPGRSLEGSQFRILDALGRQVGSGPAAAGSIDVSGLKSGVYTLTVTSAAGQTTQRFSK